MTAVIPTRRFRVVDADNGMEEIRAFLESVAAEGARPWCEVWWPKPLFFDGTDAEWDERQAETFDAVELVDGEIVTLPPYVELVGESS